MIVPSLHWADGLIIALYFAFVLGIGVWLKRSVRGSADFLSGHAVPAWVAGLAFISANLGAQEVIGMAASGAKYGIVTSHFYWVGAIPAMVFAGVFMMPFYYGSRARSVPEYLALRFDEKTRAFNAASFAVMTVISSGISLYAMAKLIQILHLLDAPLHALGLPAAWGFHASIALSAAIVLGYVFLGGLTSAIYNEVLQFFLIVAGFLPLVFLGLREVGGWPGIVRQLPAEFVHSWAGMGSPATNPFGVEWFGMVMGLGFVLSFGYWCADFLVIQRAMAADSMNAARRAPVLAAFPKMAFPFLVILPGLIAAALAAHAVPGIIPPKAGPDGAPLLDALGRAQPDYDMVVPSLLLHYFPAGMLGLGLTALLASFMSGMAGNVTAFNTVWTFDLYQAYVRKDAPDRHYLWMGHAATVFGVAASVVVAYSVTRFNNIMDVLQLVFAFVNAPLFATFLLGMFWRRTTGHGAFAGLLAGTGTAALAHGLTLPRGAGPGLHGGWLGAAVHVFPSEMAQNFWTAILAWSACFAVTVFVSLLTAPKAEEELRGLVYSLTPIPRDGERPWHQRPAVLGAIALVLVVVLNAIFW